MTLIPVNTKDLTNQIAKRARNRILVRPIRTTRGGRRKKIRTKQNDQKDAKQYYDLMLPRARRSGLERLEGRCLQRQGAASVPFYFSQMLRKPERLAYSDGGNGCMVPGAIVDRGRWMRKGFSM